MRIGNEPEETEGVLSQLFRLQAEFSTRLTDETLKYLRRLQGMAAPASPETVVLPADGDVVSAAALPGGTATIELEVENRQRVHTVVSPSLSAVVAASGATWFPQAEMDPSLLVVAPGEVRSLAIRVPVPGGAPPDTYRGAVLLPGFRDGGIPVEIVVAAPAPAKRTRKPAAKAAAEPKSGSTTRRRGAAT